MINPTPLYSLAAIPIRVWRCIVGQSMPKASTLDRSLTVMRCVKRWRCCRKYSLSASAKTAFIATVLDLVCNIRLAAVSARVAGLVSEEEYAQQVEYVRLFLSGKDDQVLTQLITRMEKASQNLEFEEAARIRDQIRAVRRVTEKQFVSNTGDDLDVIGVAFDAGMACVHVLFIREGKVLGSRSYFPKVPGGTELGEVVETFVGQFYLQGSQMRTLPGEILLDFNLSDKTLLADSLSELAGRKINVQTKPRGSRALSEAGADQRGSGAHYETFPAVDDYATSDGAGLRIEVTCGEAYGVLRH